MGQEVCVVLFWGCCQTALMELIRVCWHPSESSVPPHPHPVLFLVQSLWIFLSGDGSGTGLLQQEHEHVPANAKASMLATAPPTWEYFRGPNRRPSPSCDNSLGR